MTPPTSTDEKQGTVIDGTARSAEWREKQRAAQRPQAPASQAASTGVPAADFDPAAAKDFVSSLMIPANQLAGDTREQPAAQAPDTYINKLLDGAGDQQPTRELEEGKSASSAQSEELDRWFEEQATSVPRALAGQALPLGSASLDIETAAGASVERARRGRPFRLRVARARENREQRHRPPGRRLLQARGLTRLRVLAMTTLTVMSTVAITIATGGSPAHRSPISSTRASISATFLGRLDTVTRADRLPTIRRLSGGSRQHVRPAHRTRRTPRRRPVMHPGAATSVASTGAASNSSYTPRPTSQADSSPARAASAPSSSTGTGGASSAPASSSPPARTGPSGPISLIGAGTTPSG